MARNKNTNWTEFVPNLISMLSNIDNGRPVQQTLNHYGTIYNYNSADEGIYNTADIIQWYMYYGKNAEYWAKFNAKHPKLKCVESVTFCKALGIDYKTLVDMYKMVNRADIDPNVYNWEFMKNDAIERDNEKAMFGIIDRPDYSTDIFNDWDEYYSMGQFISTIFEEMKELYKIWFIFSLYYRNSAHLKNTIKCVITPYVLNIVHNQDECIISGVIEGLFEDSSLPYAYEYKYPDQ